MKKIFSIFASSVLALSMFVSCSGDLHNDMDPAKVALIMGETKTILDEADILGTINDWTGSALTKVDATTYTYTFTADVEDEEFSIREVAGSWTAGNRWCGALKKDEDNAVKIEPKGEAAMVYSTDPDPSHFKLTKLKVGTAYKITITIVDEDKKSLKASVNVDGDAPAAKPTPVPYVLSGIFMRGIIDPSWNCTLDACLNEFTTDKDGNVFYQKDFVADATKSVFKLGSKDWANGWGGTTFKVGEDYVEFAEKRVDGVAYMTNTGDEKESSKDTSDAFVDGMTVSKKYRIIIKTTPEKKVYAKVYEILAYTLQLKITGFDGVDGQTAIVHGTFDGWAKWTSAWGGDAKVSETATKAVIADNTAVINITSGVAAPNEEISFEGCGYYGTVEGDDIKKANGEIKIGGKDFKITGKITKAGTYVATLDLSEGEISEAVSE